MTRAFALAAALLALPATAAARPHRPSYKVVHLPRAHAWPFDLTVHRGSVWFTEQTAHRIGHVTSAGKITDFGESGGDPSAITTGPGGALWFGAEDPDSIGRATPGGHVTDYMWPFAGDASNINGLAAGPDGDLWAALSSGLARVTPQGDITVMPTGSSGLQSIVSGPRHELWFGAQDRCARESIGRFKPGGSITRTRIAGCSRGTGMSLAVGSDGNVWFTANKKVGRITPAGRVKTYAIPQAGATRWGERIAAGRRGTLWFTFLQEPAAYGVARVTTKGRITVYGKRWSDLGDLAWASGHVWLSESEKDELIRVTP